MDGRCLTRLPQWHIPIPREAADSSPPQIYSSLDLLPPASDRRFLRPNKVKRNMPMYLPISHRRHNIPHQLTNLLLLKPGLNQRPRSHRPNKVQQHLAQITTEQSEVGVLGPFAEGHVQDAPLDVDEAQGG